MRCCTIFALVLALPGCGSSEGGGPTTVPVAGTVTLNDQPLAGVEVTFVTENFSAVAKTGTDGKYALVQGAVPGKNKVTLSKWEGGNVQLNPEEGIDEGQLWSEMNSADGAVAGQDAPRQLVPADYQNLEYVVPEGGTESADFRLTGS
jgi:hypothetical protein